MRVKFLIYRVAIHIGSPHFELISEAAYYGLNYTTNPIGSLGCYMNYFNEQIEVDLNFDPACDRFV